MSDWFERFGYAEIADNLLAGAYPTDAADVAVLARDGVTCVYNLCEDCEYAEGERAGVETALGNAGIEERRMLLVDYGNVLPGHFEAAAQDILAWLEAGERVYLHCRAGWQRSAAVSAAVVALRDGVDPDLALARIRRRKPSSEPLPHQLEDLWRWWEERRSLARER